ncbi:MAG: MFS transporter [Candidatus Veblenbacteria bacterium]|nr:MFS transporter [Candidatus Veblenbacteria bacterium]
MHWHFVNTLGRLLPQHVPAPVRELYWATVLQNLALAMLLLFEPIYLWQQGFSVAQILWFFLAVYVTYFLAIPLGAKFATRFGYEHSMVLSTVAQISYYVCLYLVAASWWWAVPAVLLYTVQKTLYWPAFHADFARYSDATEEGREVSALHVTLSAVYIVGPLVGGVLITFGSWQLMFAVGSLLILISNWPFLKASEHFTPRTFSYLGAYRRLFSRENWRQLVGYMGFGEELVLLVLWPVFIATVIVEYVAIGALVAAATFVTVLATLYIGKLSDEYNKRTVLRFSVALYTLGWLARLLAHSPAGVFLVDSWSRVSKNIVQVPLHAMLYQRAKTRSVMDTVVGFEMALVVGKIVAAVVLLVIFSQLASLSAMWTATWLVAGSMALLYLVL